MLRPRIHRDGERYYGASVGVRRGRTKREQERDEREAWAQARAHLDSLKHQLARGERPDPARARRSLGVQPDLLHEATKEKARRSTSKTYESAVRMHVDRYPIARRSAGCRARTWTLARRTARSRRDDRDSARVPAGAIDPVAGPRA